MFLLKYYIVEISVASFSSRYPASQKRLGKLDHGARVREDIPSPSRDVVDSWMSNNVLSELKSWQRAGTLRRWRLAKGYPICEKRNRDGDGSFPEVQSSHANSPQTIYIFFAQNLGQKTHRKSKMLIISMISR
jgi:hypothetical protein